MPSSNSTPSMLNALLNGHHVSFLNETISISNGFGIFSVADGYEDETGFHFGEERPLPETEGAWSGEHI